MEKLERFLGGIKTMKKLLLLLFAAALSLSASEPARAWGREGHASIGDNPQQPAGRGARLRCFNRA